MPISDYDAGRIVGRTEMAQEWVDWFTQQAEWFPDLPLLFKQHLITRLNMVADTQAHQTAQWVAS